MTYLLNLVSMYGAECLKAWKYMPAVMSEGWCTQCDDFLCIAM